MTQSVQMTRDVGGTPPKYRPDDLKYTQKWWLYQKYWAELRPISEVADLADVSHTTVMNEMKRKGVPRRPKNMEAENHEHVGARLRRYFERQARTYSGERRVAWTRASDD